MSLEQPLVFKLECLEKLPFGALEWAWSQGPISRVVIIGEPECVLKMYSGDGSFVSHTHYTDTASAIAFRLSIELRRHISVQSPSTWPDWTGASFSKFDLVVSGKPEFRLSPEQTLELQATVMASLWNRPPAAELYVGALKERSELSRFVLLWAAADALCGATGHSDTVTVRQVDRFLHTLGASPPRKQGLRDERTAAAVLRNALSHPHDRGTVLLHEHGDVFTLAFELTSLLQQPISDLVSA